jgi:CheY-like chemotaxis protein
MFTQVQHPAGRAKGGLGIGLMLVKRLVEMHGGTIKAHSAGLGRGSEFTVRLPLDVELNELADEGERRTGSPASSPHCSAKSSQRILIVDDNRDAANSLALLLKFLGADAHVAYDGLSAIEIMPRLRPSAVLLDLGMPGMNGHEVARRIRSDPQFESVALVALTGWGQEDDRRRTREAGFDHHLVKPLDAAALKEVLAFLQARQATAQAI